MLASTARALLLSLACVAVHGSEAQCKSTETCAAADDAVEDTALLQKRQQVTSSEKTASIGFTQGLAKQGTPVSDRCAWVSYEATYSLPSMASDAGLEPPMVLATDENTDPRFKELNLDFNGLWWMRGDPVPELLISFAGTTVNSSTYPVELEWPGPAAGHWSWIDNFPGRIVVADTGARLDPNAMTNVTMFNDTQGDIFTRLTKVPLIWVDSYPLYKIDEDQWLRPTLFQKRSLFPDTNYTLTRVVMGDGKPHPKYWPLFLESQRSTSWLGRRGKPGSQTLISRYNNNFCQAKCEIALPCSVCRDLCGRKPTSPAVVPKSL